MPQQRPQRLVIPSIPVHDFQQYLDGRRKSYVGDFDLTPQIDDIVILQQEQQTPPPPGPQFIQTTTTHVIQLSTIIADRKKFVLDLNL